MDEVFSMVMKRGVNVGDIKSVWHVFFFFKESKMFSIAKTLMQTEAQMKRRIELQFPEFHVQICVEC